MKLSINQLKYLKSLHERKYRQKYHNFMVEGAKLAEEVLQDVSHKVEMVVGVPAWLEKNHDLVAKIDQVVAIEENELKKISLLSTPNQVLLVVKQPVIQLDQSKISQHVSLYLDDIRDPGNLGTMLRIADWFGIPWVFCSPGSVELYNPKVVQASMGAFLRVKCIEMPFEQLVDEFPELPCYGAVLDGDSIFSKKLQSPAVIAIGNESRGLSSEVLALLQHRISIPKGPNGGAESLNAAIAAGIVCAQFFKK